MPVWLTLTSVNAGYDSAIAVSSWRRNGDDGGRTRNLLVANQALSQLSYVPASGQAARRTNDSSKREGGWLDRLTIGLPTVLMRLWVAGGGTRPQSSTDPSHPLSFVDVEKRGIASEIRSQSAFIGSGTIAPRRINAAVRWVNEKTCQSGTSPCGAVAVATHCWIIEGDWLTIVSRRTSGPTRC